MNSFLLFRGVPHSLHLTAKTLIVNFNKPGILLFWCMYRLETYCNWSIRYLVQHKKMSYLVDKLQIPFAKSCFILFPSFLKIA